MRPLGDRRPAPRIVAREGNARDLQRPRAAFGDCVFEDLARRGPRPGPSGSRRGDVALRGDCVQPSDAMARRHRTRKRAISRLGRRFQMPPDTAHDGRTAAGATATGPDLAHSHRVRVVHVSRHGATFIISGAIRFALRKSPQRTHQGAPKAGRCEHGVWPASRPCSFHSFTRGRAPRIIGQLCKSNASAPFGSTRPALRRRNTRSRDCSGCCPTWRRDTRAVRVQGPAALAPLRGTAGLCHGYSGTGADEHGTNIQSCHHGHWFGDACAVRRVRRGAVGMRPRIRAITRLVLDTSRDRVPRPGHGRERVAHRGEGREL